MDELRFKQIIAAENYLSNRIILKNTIYALSRKNILRLAWLNKLCRR